MAVGFTRVLGIYIDDGILKTALNVMRSECIGKYMQLRAADYSVPIDSNSMEKCLFLQSLCILFIISLKYVYSVCDCVWILS